MESRSLGTPAAVLTALLWAATAALGMAGHGYAAMYVSLALLLVYAVQGAARGGRPSRRFLAYPLLAWIGLWAAAFWLARRYADLYAGRMPDFTVLGLHPSFAWIVLGYWLGGVATLTVGFALLRDDWLGAGQWAEFKARLAAEEAEGGER